jgi:tetratricopeptide (TPR) repeat protein
LDKGQIMRGSILILVAALSLTVALTALIVIEAPNRGENAAIDMRPGHMHLSPYKFERSLEAAMPDTPTDRIADMVTHGYDAWERGNLDEAEDIFRTVLIWDPQPNAMSAVGQLAFLDDRYEDAINFFIQYLAMEPLRVDAYTNLTASLICANRLEEAESVIRQGQAKLGKEHPGPFHFMLACVRQKSGRTESANELLVKAHSHLDASLFGLVNAHWSQSLKTLPAYAEIAAAATVKSAE